LSAILKILKHANAQTLYVNFFKTVLREFQL